MVLPPDRKPTTDTLRSHKESCATIIAFIQSEGKWQVEFFARRGVIDIFIDIH